MPADPIASSQHRARFEQRVARAPRASSVQQRTRPARFQPGRIDNHLLPSHPDMQTRRPQPGPRAAPGLAGTISLLLLAQHAGASLIGAEFGYTPPPTPHDPGPLGSGPGPWPDPAQQADLQARSRALTAAGNWPPGALAADVWIPLESAQTADDVPAPAAESLLPAAESPLVQAASNSALALCVQHPRRCGMAVALASVAVIGGGVAALFLASSSRGSAPAAIDDDDAADDVDVDVDVDVDASVAPPASGPARPRYLIDEAALPPQVRFNASELDPQRAPCASLGHHVNGRWQDSRALERSRTQQGTFVDLRDRSLVIREQIARQTVQLADPSPAEKVVADLWSTGMAAARIDSLGITPLQPALDEIDALDGPGTLAAHLLGQTVLGRNPLFELAALPDQQDPSRHMAYLSQAGLGLPDAAWYSNPAMTARVAAYTAHVATMLGLSGLVPHAAAVAAERVVALETALAEVSEPFARLAEDVSLYYNPLDLATAMRVTPRLDWSALFSAYGMAPPARISLGMPAYFEQLDDLLASVPLQDWKHYLRFHAVDRAAPCLAQRFAEGHARFHDGVLMGRRSQVPRWARVLDIIEHHAGQAMGEPYIQATFPVHANERIHDVAVQLRSALLQRLQRVPWMSPATRAAATEKARRIQIDTGAPARWPDWSGAGTQGKGFLEDVQAVTAFTHRRNIARIGQPVDGREWKMSPQTVDAYQDSFQNRIVLPAALLQPPFFDPDADAALNYGGIGVVLGHEMSHGFDSIGSVVTPDGTTRDWWSATDRARFDALADRLATQLSGYRVNGRDIDGQLTLDENLADLGGLAIAFQALQQATAGEPDPMIDGMSREQRFFANFAFCWRRAATAERTTLDMEIDNHAPSQVRADLGPSNLPAFAEAFNCAPGEPMARNASDRVRFL